MYGITVSAREGHNFIAGSFPIATDFGAIVSGAIIHPRAPVVKNSEGFIEEATEDTLEDVVGISAAEPSGDEVVYYLTGEFFQQALHYPPGVTVDTLKSPLRKLSIFLRDLDGTEPIYTEPDPPISGASLNVGGTQEPGAIKTEGGETDPLKIKE